MALQFPASPTLNQIHQDAGIVYQWNGTKWRRADIYETPTVFEYTDIVEQTSATVDIQPNKYNYYKIALDTNTTIVLPNVSPYSSIILELNYSPLLVTTGYDLENATYDNVSFSVSSQDGGPSVIFFKPDGSKMYMVGQAFDRVHQYSLSTAWDVSTASYDSVSFSVASQENNPYGIFFKPDGTKMYITGSQNDTIYQYTLSTAWDLSTASYDSVSFSVSSQDTFPSGISFKPDGTKMYILGYINDTVYQYTLSTAWDVSTASYDSVSFSVISQDEFPLDIQFKPDGTKMYIFGGSGDSVYQYTLSTPWVISTASYDSVSFNVLIGQEADPRGIFFKPDGIKMYVIGNSWDTIYQYTTSGSASVALTINWDSDIQWENGSPPMIDYTYDTTLLLHFITYDGVTWVANQLSLDSRSS